MPEHVFRCVNVAAVSTPGQAADDKASIPNQVRENSEIIARMGWAEIAQVVIPGHSRNYWSMADLCGDCPEYAELVRLIEAEQVDLVVCWRWNRIWRNQWIGTDLERVMARHRTQAFARHQGSLPVPPESITNWKLPGFRNIDKKVDQAASEEFLKELRAKHRLGMESNINDDGRHHSQQPAYGYEHDRERNLIVVPDEAVWVRWIFDQYNAGLGLTAIARELMRRGVLAPSAHPQRGGRTGNTLWYNSTVSDILHRRLYLGTAYWGQAENTEARHEEIISPEVFERAQRAIGQRSQRSDRIHTDAWLAGLARCGFCHQAMIDKHIDGNPYYYCGHHKRTHGAQCVSNGNSGRRAHAYVQAQLIQMLTDPALWLGARAEQHNLPQTRDRVAEIDRQRASNRRAHQRAYDAYLAGASSAGELKATRDRLDAEHETLSHERGMLTSTLADADHALAIFEDVAPIAGEFAYLPDAEKHRYARLLIRAVYLAKGSPPRIVWR